MHTDAHTYTYIYTYTYIHTHTHKHTNLLQVTLLPALVKGWSVVGRVTENRFLVVRTGQVIHPCPACGTDFANVTTLFFSCNYIMTIP